MCPAIIFLAPDTQASAIIAVTGDSGVTVIAGQEVKAVLMLCALTGDLYARSHVHIAYRQESGIDADSETLHIRIMGRHGKARYRQRVEADTHGAGLLGDAIEIQ